jgi:hypothetical protein
MQIVIDIPEKYLNSDIIDVTLFPGATNTITDVNVEDEYAKFQVLPKGHGRLIDADAKNKELADEYHGMISDESIKIYKIIQTLDDAPTIIEADKGAEE